MRASAFPRGSFHLRKFRLKDESFLDFFKSAQATKPAVIEALLAAHPARDFVLIGDSGEEDPEIYGDLARSQPGRVRHIYIRQVTPYDAGRYRSVFAGLPPALWTVFTDPGVIAPNSEPQ